MRVSSNKTNNAPYAMPFSWFNALVDENGDNLPFENTLSSDMLPTQQSVNVSETFRSKIWESITPGLERVCVILRSHEFSHSEIGWIVGLNTDEVSRVLYKVKNRLTKLGLTKDNDNF